MYLKKLELFGFKSFAAKTVLEFNKGITAVVGPNGSGKSNVADALRWVLGEQSLKNIRTKKGEDLIFAGAPQKPQMSKAQVSLHLDNSDGFFPVAFPEIEISRKIFRDGTAEYLLNKNAVRLKDIIEFLAAAHLGVKGFNVVNQGAADAILNASPQEKREIIEEALGLREYQLKKLDAQHKLEGATVNLDKARALIAEIEPHARSLARQVKKFQKREEIARELKTAAQDYFSGIFLNLQQEKERLEGQKKEREEIFHRLQSEVRELETRLKEEETRLPDFFQQFSEYEGQLRNIQKEISGVERELGRVEGLIEAEKNSRRRDREFAAEERSETFDPAELRHYAREVRAELQGLLRIDSLELMKEKVAAVLKGFEAFFSSFFPPSGDVPEGRELEKKDETKTAANAEQRQSTAAVNPELESKKGELQKKLNGLSEETKRLQDLILQTRKKERSEKEQFFELKTRVDQKRAQTLEWEGKVNVWEIERQKIQLKEDDLRQRIAEAELTLEELGSGHSSGASKEELEPKMAKLRRELGEIGGIDPEVIKEHSEVSRRHEFLASQLTDLEQSIKSLRELIGDLEEKIEKEFSSALVHINREFDKYFILMFGGGRAEIKSFDLVHRVKAIPLPEGEEMTEVEEAILKERQLGLEIKVDLPRKHIKDIHAMSGGERALTSIALLFGIIAVSPPPFLILDEIDAALDESNSQRFGKMLKELGKKTQFIVITHNKETMRQSNVMYGVTMEDGCSKLLSLKFEEGVV